MNRRAALFSIHDVMPSTLDATESISARLADAGITKVTLLVVPDTGWDAAAIDRLRALEANGADLAGHGWRHRVRGIRNIRHWLHSVFISRDVAEHLALDRSGAIKLMQDCYDWFGENGLGAPDVYVPPAWAMGSARREDLDMLPYRRFESLYGVYDSDVRRFQRTPMIGFEADTPFRAFACRVWNRWNLRSSRQPLRFSIHPGDPELLLGADLERLLGQPWDDLYYTDPLPAPVA
jgi:predicted deacetylase